MTRRSRVRTLAIAAAIGAVALALSGCTTLAGRIAAQSAHSQSINTGTKLAAGDKPVVGDCWKGTYKDVTYYANWNDSAPVSCASAHQLYTFAAPNLRKSHSGAEFSANGQTPESLANDAYSTCYGEQQKVFPVLDMTEQLLVFDSLLPNPGQWAAGARWVRCDVGVIAYGSALRTPTLGTLPSFDSVKNDLTRTDDFNYCVNDPNGTDVGPFSAGATYANCTAKPDWTLTTWVFVQAGTPDFPGQAYLTQQYQQQCAAEFASAGKVTFPTYPSKSGWADSNQSIGCWVGTKS